ncbi:hypothetical protein ACFL6C_04915 [Myxococcota bacterium]
MAKAAGVTGRVFDLARQLLAIGGPARKGKRGSRHQRWAETRRHEPGRRCDHSALSTITTDRTRDNLSEVQRLCGRGLRWMITAELC